MLAGLEYGTIIDGRPGLFQGGAARRSPATAGC